MKNLHEVIKSHHGQILNPFSRAQELLIERNLKLLYSVQRRRQSIDFSFSLTSRVAADIGKIKIPSLLEIDARQRRDELWKSTCLEIFVGGSDDQSYLEMNLSPSGHWNMYFFEKYRSEQREVSEPRPPLTKVEQVVNGDMLIWHGSLTGGPDISALLEQPNLVMSATAVLQYHSGENEYWAINHAGEKPDFHLRKSFRLHL